MYLLFDIGGTKMRISYSHNGEEFDEPKVFDTPQDFQNAKAFFSEYKDKSIQAVGGGIAGVLDKYKTTLLRSPNLPNWIGVPIQEELQKLFNTQVYLENDADMAGLGEAYLGAGRGYRIVAYLTVGTGVGGARIVDGKLDIAHIGFEPGHQIIDFDESVYQAGDLEYLVSGSGLKKRYGKNPEEITDAGVWSEVSKYLAYGLNNTIVHWSPNVIVLGGGLVVGNKIPLEEVRQNLSEIVTIFPEIPELKKAELGDFSGLHGVLFHLKNLIKN